MSTGLVPFQLRGNDLQVAILFPQNVNITMYMDGDSSTISNSSEGTLTYNGTQT
ncbi:MAG TPA: hypothetical protein VFV86_10810 [Nitrososphaeraceae archaeon]|nr:hypothetical protein [Nitrososphaeraceae archaeon]